MEKYGNSALISSSREILLIMSNSMLIKCYFYILTTLPSLISLNSYQLHINLINGTLSIIHWLKFHKAHRYMNWYLKLILSTWHGQINVSFSKPFKWSISRISYNLLIKTSIWRWSKSWFFLLCKGNFGC